MDILGLGNQPIMSPFQCPVCYETIIYPVVFPCQHEICRDCFTKSIDSANYFCPLCRKRISSWARKNKNNPVNEKRKKEIDRWLELQEKENMIYGTKYKARSLPRICKSGEVREEYLSQIQKVKEEREKEEEESIREACRLHHEEEMLLKQKLSHIDELKLKSEATALYIQEEEKRAEEHRLKQLEEDEKMAHCLSQIKQEPLSNGISKDHQRRKKQSTLLTVLRTGRKGRRNVDIKAQDSSRPITHWFKPANT